MIILAAVVVVWAAMIASKLLLVIIFMIGVSVIEGVGMSAQPGPGQELTQLATGSLILLMGGFAPWAAIKMFHFTGDALYAAHASVAQAPSGGRTVLAAPQKLNAMHSQASHAIAKVSSTGAGGRAGTQPSEGERRNTHTEARTWRSPEWRGQPRVAGKGQPSVATAKSIGAGTGSSTAAGGSGGAAAGGGSGGAAAAGGSVAAAAVWLLWSSPRGP